MLKVSELSKIRYTKKTENGEEVTERVILPTFVPAPRHKNVKAIDVSQFNQQLQEELAGLMKNYHDYLEEKRKSTMTFEEFVEEHRNMEIGEKLKWRTFKPTQLKEL
jgi:hypothetical protein